jgi:hypothetical protein
MSYDYQFSVGQITVKTEAGSNEQGVGIMTEISVSYDGDPQSFYGGDYRLPLAVELGNRSGEITATSSRWSVTDAMLTNHYVDIVLAFGKNSGGLAGTIEGCKLTNYSVKSTQNDYVTSDLTWAICDPAHITKGTSAPTWDSNV